jgi:phage terminase small subunit
MQTLENKAIQQTRNSQADAQADSALAVDEAQNAPPVKPGELTARQQTFARLYVETGVAVDAYMAAYLTNSSRASARVDAYRLLRNPKVAARVRELQDAAASRSLRSTAALIAELEEMVDADPNELCSLTVGACRYCHSTPPGSYHWRDEREMAKAVDAWLASISSPLPLPAPDTTGSMGYRADCDPNPECRTCNGQGVPRVVFTSTADVSRGARRLLRGIELFPDGQVKRLLLHDQTQLRVELHRLRGLHVDRSVSINANVNVPALPKNLSVADALRMLESIAPAPADDSTVIESEQ